MFRFGQTMQTILDTQNDKRKPHKKNLVIALMAVLALVAVIAGFSRNAEPATIDVEQLLIGTVRFGSLVQDVQAPGNLTSNHRQWIAAQGNAKISKRLLEPGAEVAPDSVILKLSSPDLVQEFKQQKIQFEVVQAQLDALQETQNTERRKLQAAVSLLEVEKQQAIEDRLAKQQLRVTKIIPEYKYQEAVLRERQLTLQLEIARLELEQLPRLQASLLKVEQAKLEQQKLQVSLLEEQVAQLDVKAGMHGILQSIAVEEGQEVVKGAELAQVADQKNLKAELRVQESQARDIKVGQLVKIDTRRSQLQGQVTRIDPSVLNGTVTVDISLPRDLPTEARPDLRVNGIIEIERLDKVLLLDKPANWRESETAFLFKFEDANVAVKTQVTFGASSTSEIQLLAGLKEGDRVILSPLPEYSGRSRLVINQ